MDLFGLIEENKKRRRKKKSKYFRFTLWGLQAKSLSNIRKIRFFGKSKELISFSKRETTGGVLDLAVTYYW